MRSPVVLKFGGASLDDLLGVAELTREERSAQNPLVLVVSARRGVTDDLVRLRARPREGRLRERVLESLRDLHPGLPPAGARALDRVARITNELSLGRGQPIFLGEELLSQGERLAAHWLARELRDLGIPCVALEADALGFRTENEYPASELLLERSRSGVRSHVVAWIRRGRLPIVTGFFGRSLEGRVATLGRGGSDYTATALGWILGASRVDLVKQYDPVCSADPMIVVSARPIPHLSYRQADELAQFGARVLHPLTVGPARTRRILLRIRTLDRSGFVTEIGPAAGAGTMRALTLLESRQLLRIWVPGGRQRPGIVAGASAALTRAGVSVVSIFTSCASLCFVLEPTDGQKGFRALRPLANVWGTKVEGPEPVDLVTAIGEGILEDMHRIPASILNQAAAYIAAPQSLAVAVPTPGGRSALRRMHRALVPGRPR